MFSPETKRNIARVTPFGAIWLIFSLVYVLLERGLLGDVSQYPATGNPYNFARNIYITPLCALIAGVGIGMLEIRYFHKFFNAMNFGRKLFFKTATYLIIIISFLLITSIITNVVELRTTVFSTVVWINVRTFLLNFAFWSTVIYMGAIIVVSQFYTELSENLGPGVLHNFFTGRYHQPKEEERIFMFLDMKSSTTIAETLGHVRYFEMLKQYYADLSEPIVKHSGEVYQYAGDEIIVSWKLREKEKDNDWLNCFFAIKSRMSNEADKYEKVFGLVPAFKAGFHIGKVTAGEIGEAKKEIMFTGDVLNTTARIQGLCNSHDVNILVSGELIERLASVEGIEIISLGENELRGRDEKIKLFTISQQPNQ